MIKQIFILLFMCTSVCAQDLVISNVADVTVEDYINLKLPPLAELLDNSRKNPSVVFYENRKLEEISELKSIKREWLNYVKVNLNYQYGVVNDLTSFVDISSTYISQYSGKLQNLYGVGATLSVPFLEIFDRKNKITRQKIRIQAASYEVGRTKEDIDLKIIDAYTLALQNIALLKASAESVTLADAQYRLCERDFINGKTDAQTLSSQKNMQTQTLRENEATRAAVNNAILRLELLSRTKILK